MAKAVFIVQLGQEILVDIEGMRAVIPLPARLQKSSQKAISDYACSYFRP